MTSATGIPYIIYGPHTLYTTIQGSRITIDGDRERAAGASTVLVDKVIRIIYSLVGLFANDDTLVRHRARVKRITGASFIFILDRHATFRSKLRLIGIEFRPSG